MDELADALPLYRNIVLPYEPNKAADFIASQASIVNTI
jgi:hypothetical protein